MSNNVEELRRALEHDQRNMHLRLELASALLAANRHQEAATMYISVARVHHMAGRIEQARAVCKTILEFSPSHTESIALLSQISQEQHRIAPPPPPISTRSPGQIPNPLALQELNKATQEAISQRPGSAVRVTFRSPTSTMASQAPPLKTTEIELPPLATSQNIAATPGLIFRPIKNEQAPPEPSPPTALPSISFDKKTPSSSPSHELLPVEAILLAEEFLKPSPSEAVQATEPALPSTSANNETLSPPYLPQILARLANSMRVTRFAAGENILHKDKAQAQAQAKDTLFLIAQGRAQILKQSSEHPELSEIATLNEGEIFGGFALLANLCPQATVRAVEECVLYEIPREPLDEFTATYPEMANHCKRYYRDRLLQTLLDTSLFFSPLTPSERQQLLDKLHILHPQAGEQILEKGQPSPGLHLILLGSVDLLETQNTELPKVATTLHEETYFGHHGLLQGQPAQLTAVARVPTEIALLPASDFHKLLLEHPILWVKLRDSSASLLNELQ